MRAHRYLGPIGAVALAAILAAPGARCDPTASASVRSCFDEAAASIRPDTRVTIDLANGESRHGIGLYVGADSVYYHREGDAPSRAALDGLARDDVAGFRFQTRRKVNPHWGLIGFGVGCFVSVSAWRASHPESQELFPGFGLSLVGLFGGFIGAGAGALLPPITVDAGETHLQCDASSK